MAYRDDDIAVDGAAVEAEPPVDVSGVDPTPAAKRKTDKSVPITVRLVEQTDLEPLRDMVRRFHERTVFGDIPFSDAKFDKYAAHYFSGAARWQCCIVAECRGELMGMAWFSAGQYLFGEGELLTSVHALVVDQDRCPPFRRVRVQHKLIKGVKLWAESQGAKRVLVHDTSGAMNLHRFRFDPSQRAAPIGASILIIDK